MLTVTFLLGLSFLSPVLEIAYCSVKCFFQQTFLSVDGTPQVDRNILLTGLFMVTGILSRRVSKAYINSLTGIRP